MLPALASVSALEGWLGSPIIGGPELTTRAEALLARASTLVRAETGRAWVDAEGDLVDLPAEVDDLLSTVVIQAAGRAWRNPNAAIHNVSGPFSERYSEAAADGLYLSDTDRSLCAAAVRAMDRDEAGGDPTARPGIAGLSTIRTTRTDGLEGTTYAPVEGGGEPFPMVRLEEPW